MPFWEWRVSWKWISSLVFLSAKAPFVVCSCSSACFGSAECKKRFSIPPKDRHASLFRAMPLIRTKDKLKYMYLHLFFLFGDEKEKQTQVSWKSACCQQHWIELVETTNLSHRKLESVFAKFVGKLIKYLMLIPNNMGVWQSGLIEYRRNMWGHCSQESQSTEEFLCWVYFAEMWKIRCSFYASDAQKRSAGDLLLPFQCF